jgi:transposase
MMDFIFQQALHINDPWFIKSIDFNEEQKRLDIHIDFKRGAKFTADGDSEKSYTAYDTVVKTWRHLNFFEHECYLHTRVPRVKNNEGKLRLISPPWSGVVNGFTLLFEALIMQLARSMPVHNVAKLTGISDYKIWSLLDIYVTKAKEAENLSEVAAIGIDETSIAKGHDYISLFVDLNEKRVMHVSDGKSNQTVVDFVKAFENKGGVVNNIKDVSCDMSKAFIKGVRENLPDAQITFDKFHIMKIINDGVNKVRQVEAISNPLLKGTRYIFLKNDSNLTEKQKAKKDELSLSKLNLRSVRAMNIRETFQQIYSAETPDEFELLLNKWYGWITRCQIPQMLSVAKTIKKHWEGILRWKESQINNGILEGLNSVLQAAKRKARGYKSAHFKTITYLLTGKLDFSKVNSKILPT